MTHEPDSPQLVSSPDYVAEVAAAFASAPGASDEEIVRIVRQRLGGKANPRKVCDEVERFRRRQKEC